MNKDSVIGLIYMFDHNDYQISLMSFSDEDQKLLQELMMKYANECSCARGDKNLTIDDANIDYWEMN